MSEALSGGDCRRRAGGGRRWRWSSGCAASPARWSRPGSALSHIPKGQNLTQRTLEHFYFWGVVEELRAARLMPPGYPIGEVTAYGNLMSDYWQAPPGREVVRRLLLPGQRPHAAVPDGEGAATKMARNCRMSTAASAGRRLRCRAGRSTACASTIAEEDGPGREVWEADYVRRLRRRPLDRAQRRSASSAAAPISTSSWCWSCSARANCTSDSSAFPSARPIGSCTRT